MLTTFAASSGGTIIILFVSFFLLGYFLPKTRVFTYEFEIECSMQKLWDILTDIEQFPSWQQNLRRIDVIDKSKKQVTQWGEVPYRGKIIRYKKQSEKKYQYLAYSLQSAPIFSGMYEVKLVKKPKTIKIKLAKSIVITNPMLRIMSYLKLHIKKDMKLWQKQLQQLISS